MRKREVAAEVKSLTAKKERRVVINATMLKSDRDRIVRFARAEKIPVASFVGALAIAMFDAGGD